MPRKKILFSQAIKYITTMDYSNTTTGTPLDNLEIITEKASKVLKDNIDDIILFEDEALIKEEDIITEDELKKYTNIENWCNLMCACFFIYGIIQKALYVGYKLTDIYQKQQRLAINEYNSIKTSIDNFEKQSGNKLSKQDKDQEYPLFKSSLKQKLRIENTIQLCYSGLFETLGFDNIGSANIIKNYIINYNNKIQSPDFIYRIFFAMEDKTEMAPNRLETVIILDDDDYYYLKKYKVRGESKIDLNKSYNDKVNEQLFIQEKKNKYLKNWLLDFYNHYSISINEQKGAIPIELGYIWKMCFFNESITDSGSLSYNISQLIEEEMNDKNDFYKSVVKYNNQTDNVVHKKNIFLNLFTLKTLNDGNLGNEENLNTFYTKLTNYYSNNVTIDDDESSKNRLKKIQELIKLFKLLINNENLNKLNYTDFPLNQLIIDEIYKGNDPIHKKCNRVYHEFNSNHKEFCKNYVFKSESESDKPNDEEINMLGINYLFEGNQFELEDIGTIFTERERNQSEKYEALKTDKLNNSNILNLETYDTLTDEERKIYLYKNNITDLQFLSPEEKNRLEYNIKDNYTENYENTLEILGIYANLSGYKFSYSGYKHNEKKFIWEQRNEYSKMPTPISIITKPAHVGGATPTGENLSLNKTNNIEIINGLSIIFNTRILYDKLYLSLMSNSTFPRYKDPDFIKPDNIDKLLTYRTNLLIMIVLTNLNNVTIKYGNFKENIHLDNIREFIIDKLCFIYGEEKEEKEKEKEKDINDTTHIIFDISKYNDGVVRLEGDKNIVLNSLKKRLQLIFGNNLSKLKNEEIYNKYLEKAKKLEISIDNKSIIRKNKFHPVFDEMIKKRIRDAESARSYIQYDKQKLRLEKKKIEEKLKTIRFSKYPKKKEEKYLDDYKKQIKNFENQHKEQKNDVIELIHDIKSIKSTNKLIHHVIKEQMKHFSDVANKLSDLVLTLIQNITYLIGEGEKKLHEYRNTQNTDTYVFAPEDSHRKIFSNDLKLTGIEAFEKLNLGDKYSKMNYDSYINDNYKTNPENKDKNIDHKIELYNEYEKQTQIIDFIIKYLDIIFSEFPIKSHASDDKEGVETNSQFLYFNYYTLIYDLKHTKDLIKYNNSFTLANLKDIIDKDKEKQNSHFSLNGIFFNKTDFSPKVSTTNYNADRVWPILKEQDQNYIVNFPQDQISLINEAALLVGELQFKLTQKDVYVDYSRRSEEGDLYWRVSRNSNSIYLDNFVQHCMELSLKKEKTDVDINELYTKKFCKDNNKLKETDSVEYKICVLTQLVNFIVKGDIPHQLLVNKQVGGGIITSLSDTKELIPMLGGANTVRLDESQTSEVKQSNFNLDDFFTQETAVHQQYEDDSYEIAAAKRREEREKRRKEEDAKLKKEQDKEDRIFKYENLIDKFNYNADNIRITIEEYLDNFYNMNNSDIDPRDKSKAEWNMKQSKGQLIKLYKNQFDILNSKDFLFDLDFKEGRTGDIMAINKSNRWYKNSNLIEWSYINTTTPALEKAHGIFREEWRYIDSSELNRFLYNKWINGGMIRLLDDGLWYPVIYCDGINSNGWNEYLNKIRFQSRPEHSYYDGIFSNISRVGPPPSIEPGTLEISSRGFWIPYKMKNSKDTLGYNYDFTSKPIRWLNKLNSVIKKKEMNIENDLEEHLAMLRMYLYDIYLTRNSDLISLEPLNLSGNISLHDGNNNRDIELTNLSYYHNDNVIYYKGSFSIDDNTIDKNKLNFAMVELELNKLTNLQNNIKELTKKNIETIREKNNVFKKLGIEDISKIDHIDFNVTFFITDIQEDDDNKLLINFITAPFADQKDHDIKHFIKDLLNMADSEVGEPFDQNNEIVQEDRSNIEQLYKELNDMNTSDGGPKIDKKIIEYEEKYHLATIDNKSTDEYLKFLRYSYKNDMNKADKIIELYNTYIKKNRVTKDQITDGDKNITIVKVGEKIKQMIYPNDNIEGRILKITIEGMGQVLNNTKELIKLIKSNLTDQNIKDENIINIKFSDDSKTLELLTAQEDVMEKDGIIKIDKSEIIIADANELNKKADFYPLKGLKEEQEFTDCIKKIELPQKGGAGAVDALNWVAGKVAGKVTSLFSGTSENDTNMKINAYKIFYFNKIDELYTLLNSKFLVENTYIESSETNSGLGIFWYFQLKDTEPTTMDQVKYLLNLKTQQELKVDCKDATHVQEIITSECEVSKINIVNKIKEWIDLSTKFKTNFHSLLDKEIFSDLRMNSDRLFDETEKVFQKNEDWKINAKKIINYKSKIVTQELFDKYKDDIKNYISAIDEITDVEKLKLEKLNEFMYIDRDNWDANDTITLFNELNNDIDHNLTLVNSEDFKINRHDRLKKTDFDFNLPMNELNNEPLQNIITDLVKDLNSTISIIVPDNESQSSYENKDTIETILENKQKNLNHYVKNEKNIQKLKTEISNLSNYYNTQKDHQRSNFNYNSFIEQFLTDIIRVGDIENDLNKYLQPLLGSDHKLLKNCITSLHNCLWSVKLGSFDEVRFNQDDTEIIEKSTGNEISQVTYSGKPDEEDNIKTLTWKLLPDDNFNPELNDSEDDRKKKYLNFYNSLKTEEIYLKKINLIPKNHVNPVEERKIELIVESSKHIDVVSNEIMDSHKHRFPIFHKDALSPAQGNLEVKKEKGYNRDISKENLIRKKDSIYDILNDIITTKNEIIGNINKLVDTGLFKLNDEDDLYEKSILDNDFNLMAHLSCPHHNIYKTNEHLELISNEVILEFLKSPNSILDSQDNANTIKITEALKLIKNYKSIEENYSKYDDLYQKKDNHFTINEKKMREKIQILYKKLEDIDKKINDVSKNTADTQKKISIIKKQFGGADLKALENEKNEVEKEIKSLNVKLHEKTGETIGNIVNKIYNLTNLSNVMSWWSYKPPPKINDPKVETNLDLKYKHMNKFFRQYILKRSGKLALGITSSNYSSEREDFEYKTKLINYKNYLTNAGIEIEISERLINTMINTQLNVTQKAEIRQKQRDIVDLNTKIETLANKLEQKNETSFINNCNILTLIYEKYQLILGLTKYIDCTEDDERCNELKKMINNIPLKELNHIIDTLRKPFNELKKEFQSHKFTILPLDENEILNKFNYKIIYGSKLDSMYNFITGSVYDRFEASKQIKKLMNNYMNYDIYDLVCIINRSKIQKFQTKNQFTFTYNKHSVTNLHDHLIQLYVKSIQLHNIKLKAYSGIIDKDYEVMQLNKNELWNNTSDMLKKLDKRSFRTDILKIYTDTNYSNIVSDKEEVNCSLDNIKDQLMDSTKECVKMNGEILTEFFKEINQTGSGTSLENEEESIQEITVAPDLIEFTKESTLTSKELNLYMAALLYKEQILTELNIKVGGLIKTYYTIQNAILKDIILGSNNKGGMYNDFKTLFLKYINDFENFKDDSEKNKINSLFDRIKSCASGYQKGIHKAIYGDSTMQPFDDLNSLRKMAVKGAKTELTMMIFNFVKDSLSHFKGKYLNFVIMGPAGSGKTTGAYVMANTFNKIGCLLQGNTDIKGPTDLKGSYVGQTGPKTRNLLVENLENILVIDEAYQITDCSTDDNGIVTMGDGGYGFEAITEMVAFLDKNIETISVIAAGYRNEITTCFLGANEGMSRRFPNRLIYNKFNPIILSSMARGGITNVYNINNSLIEINKTKWVNENLFEYLKELKNFYDIISDQKNNIEDKLGTLTDKEYKQIVDDNSELPDLIKIKKVIDNYKPLQDNDNDKYKHENSLLLQQKNNKVFGNQLTKNQKFINDFINLKESGTRADSLKISDIMNIFFSNIDLSNCHKDSRGNYLTITINNLIDRLSIIYQSPILNNDINSDKIDIFKQGPGDMKNLHVMLISKLGIKLDSIKDIQYFFYNKVYLLFMYGYFSFAQQKNFRTPFNFKLRYDLEIIPYVEISTHDKSVEVQNHNLFDIEKSNYPLSTDLIENIFFNKIRNTDLQQIQLEGLPLLNKKDDSLRKHLGVNRINQTLLSLREIFKNYIEFDNNGERYFTTNLNKSKEEVVKNFREYFEQKYITDLYFGKEDDYLKSDDKDDELHKSYESKIFKDNKNFDNISNKIELILKQINNITEDGDIRDQIKLYPNHLYLESEEFNNILTDELTEEKSRNYLKYLKEYNPQLINLSTDNIKKLFSKVLGEKSKTSDQEDIPNFLTIFKYNLDQYDNNFIIENITDMLEFMTELIQDEDKKIIDEESLIKAISKKMIEFINSDIGENKKLNISGGMKKLLTKKNKKPISKFIYSKKHITKTDPSKDFNLIDKYSNKDRKIKLSKSRKLFKGGSDSSNMRQQRFRLNRRNAIMGNIHNNINKRSQREKQRDQKPENEKEAKETEAAVQEHVRTGDAKAAQMKETNTVSDIVQHQVNDQNNTEQSNMGETFDFSVINKSNTIDTEPNSKSVDTSLSDSEKTGQEPVGVTDRSWFRGEPSQVSPRSDRSWFRRDLGQVPYSISDEELDEVDKTIAELDRMLDDGSDNSGDDQSSGDKPTGETDSSKPWFRGNPGDKPAGDKPSGDKPEGDKPTGETDSSKSWFRGNPGDKPAGDKPSGDKPEGDKPTGETDSSKSWFRGNPGDKPSGEADSSDISMINRSNIDTEDSNPNFNARDTLASALLMSDAEIDTTIADDESDKSGDDQSSTNTGHELYKQYLQKTKLEGRSPGVHQIVSQKKDESDFKGEPSQVSPGLERILSSNTSEAEKIEEITKFHDETTFKEIIKNTQVFDAKTNPKIERNYNNGRMEIKIDGKLNNKIPQENQNELIKKYIESVLGRFYYISNLKITQTGGASSDNNNNVNVSFDLTPKSDNYLSDLSKLIEQVSNNNLILSKNQTQLTGLIETNSKELSKFGDKLSQFGDKLIENNSSELSKFGDKLSQFGDKLIENDSSKLSKLSDKITSGLITQKLFDLNNYLKQDKDIPPRELIYLIKILNKLPVEENLNSIKSILEEQINYLIDKNNDYFRKKVEYFERKKTEFKTDVMDITKINSLIKEIDDFLDEITEKYNIDIKDYDLKNELYSDVGSFQSFRDTLNIIIKFNLDKFKSKLESKLEKKALGQKGLTSMRDKVLTAASVHSYAKMMSAAKEDAKKAAEEDAKKVEEEAVAIKQAEEKAAKKQQNSKLNIVNKIDFQYENSNSQSGGSNATIEGSENIFSPLVKLFIHDKQDIFVNYESIKFLEKLIEVNKKLLNEEINKLNEKLKDKDLSKEDKNELENKISNNYIFIKNFEKILKEIKFRLHIEKHMILGPSFTDEDHELKEKDIDDSNILKNIYTMYNLEGFKDYLYGSNIINTTKNFKFPDYVTKIDEKNINKRDYELYKNPDIIDIIPIENDKEKRFKLTIRSTENHIYSYLDENKIKEDSQKQDSKNDNYRSTLIVLDLFEYKKTKKTDIENIETRLNEIYKVLSSGQDRFIQDYYNLLYNKLMEINNKLNDLSTNAQKNKPMVGGASIPPISIITKKSDIDKNLTLFEEGLNHLYVLLINNNNTNTELNNLEKNEELNIKVNLNTCKRQMDDIKSKIVQEKKNTTDSFEKTHQTNHHDYNHDDYKIAEEAYKEKLKKLNEQENNITDLLDQLNNLEKEIPELNKKMELLDNRHRNININIRQEVNTEYKLEEIPIKNNQKSINQLFLDSDWEFPVSTVTINNDENRIKGPSDFISKIKTKVSIIGNIPGENNPGENNTTKVSIIHNISGENTAGGNISLKLRKKYTNNKKKTNKKNINKKNIYKKKSFMKKKN